MARYTVITYQCPRCRADLGRQFGLITRLSIPCPSCGTRVRIDTNVIAQNWAFNFGWVGGLLVWFALAVGVLADQRLAAAIGGKAFPSATFENRLVLAGVCALPGLLAGLVAGGVGVLLGTIVAFGGSADTAPAEPNPQNNRGGYLGGNFTGAPPAPRERSLLVRVFFVLLWPAVFFVGAAIVMAGLAGSFSAESEAVRKQINEQSAQKNAWWIFLVSLIVFISGCVGVLPGTGRKKQSPAPEQPEPRGPEPVLPPWVPRR